MVKSDFLSIGRLCLGSFSFLDRIAHLEAVIGSALHANHNGSDERLKDDCGNPLTLDDLLTGARHADPLVKGAVARVLSTAKQDSDDVRACLQEMMRDPSPAVALQAAVALACQPGRRDPNLYSRLTSLVDGRTYTVEVLGVRDSKGIASELKQISDSAFSNEIVREIWSEKTFERCLAIDSESAARIHGCRSPHLVMTVRSEDSNSIVGFLVASSSRDSGDQIVLANLAFLKEYRGKQLASKLLNHAEKLLARLGYATLMRECTCSGGWAARIESNLAGRGVLISRQDIHSPDGRKVRMIMRLSPDSVGHAS